MLSPLSDSAEGAGAPGLAHRAAGGRGPAPIQDGSDEKQKTYLYIYIYIYLFIYLSIYLFIYIYIYIYVYVYIDNYINIFICIFIIIFAFIPILIRVS